MAVSPEEARALALSLPEAVEQDHHGRPSFRVGGKIFATLWSEERMNVMLDESGVLTAVETAPDACQEVWWGKRLAAVGVTLAQVDPEFLRELLTDAWETRAPSVSSATEQTTMLELRPNCELCDRDLPPDSPDARICTYECTFCADCVENVLHDVCPNCGGNFEARPVRPKRSGGTGRASRRPPGRGGHTSSREEITAFVEPLRGVPPSER